MVRMGLRSARSSSPVAACSPVIHLFVPPWKQQGSNSLRGERAEAEENEREEEEKNGWRG